MAQPSGTGVTFMVTVQPKASRNKVGGYETGTLRLRVTAPPHDGKANEAVVSLLAETLDVAKSQVPSAYRAWALVATKDHIGGVVDT